MRDVRVSLMRQMIFVKTRINRKRKPLDVTPAGVPNTVLWGDNTEPFIPASYMANVPEPKKDPLWYMRPRLPMGVPWTLETAQWLESEIAEWEAMYGNKKGR